MRVNELIELLKRFEAEAEVHLCVSMPGRVIETHDTVWVADYGSGPQINAALDFKQFSVYVGCGMEQLVRKVPDAKPGIDLGRYENAKDAAKVHDFYVLNQGLDEPLRFPDFDYENWIPPRTVAGQYNRHIAKILREKLLRE